MNTSGADASFWLETCGDDLTERAPLNRDVDVDVAIVGAGLTGLWTALQLRRRQPDCRIAVVESRIAGFGASGRNGGWCSALFPASSAQLAAMADEDTARALHRAMIDTVTQVGHDIAELGIDCHWARGGTLTLATNPAHVGRLRGLVSESRRWGFGEDDLRWLTPAEASERVRTPALFGATFTPHCAAVQPAMLVRQLARRVESQGVAIYEGSPVREIGPGYADCAGGRVRADVVLRCTEGYTPALRGHGRDVVPIYSMLIATETLSDEAWDEIGLADRPTFSDGRHLLIYGQRTADGRLAFGGRGAPYHFGSRVEGRFDRDESIAGLLTAAMHELFPATRRHRVTHHWGGPLAVPRDWCASVGLDRASGLGWAGGYVGDGVSTTHLAGRTLADLVCGIDSEETRLPWVNHRSPHWEPEPLRWLGVNAGRTVAAAADRRENARRRPAVGLERVMNRLVGH